MTRMTSDTHTFAPHPVHSDATGARRRPAPVAVLAALASVVALVVLLAGCDAASGARASATPTATGEPLIVLPLPPVTGTRLPDANPLVVTVRQTLGKDVLDSATTLDDGIVRVTTIIASNLPETPEPMARARARAEVLCVRVHRALWQRPTSDLRGVREIRVTILGPMLDDYFSRTTGVYANGIVRSETAAAIPWATASDDEAWSRFDTAWLAPRFEPNKIFWIFTPTPTAR